MDSYEQWTRGEISRLRDEAQRSAAAADTLQATLDRWLESHGGKKNESRATGKGEESHGLNGHIPPRRTRRPGYGDKNATALEKIRAATPSGGLTTDELWESFSELFGPKYKRSSLRALLWHQKDLGHIENRNGRYVIAQGSGA